MKAKGYLYVFGMGMQKAMAYRADFFLGLVSCLFPIVMQVFLWNALYAAGAALIAWGWRREGLAVTLTSVAGFAALCLAGLFLTYCLFLIPELLSFWFVAGNGMQALSSAVFDFNNTPMNLYPHWVRRLGVFVLPVFVITNFPTLFAAGKLPPALTAWGLAVPVLAFGVQRLVWRRALRRYTSAGG